MAIELGTNFQLRATEFNFERDAFQTLAEMKDFNLGYVPDGFSTFCLEDRTRYIMNKGGTNDPKTGYWEKDSSSGSADSYVEVGFEELKTLVENSQMTIGASYRITDFVTEINYETLSSAGHPFDLIVTATGSNKLSENAKCRHREGDDYFSGSDLEAWEIKYKMFPDLEGDEYRYSASTKGVITYMKDEFGNEAGYDFKNILTLIPVSFWTENASNITTSGTKVFTTTPVTDKLFYTFSWVENDIITDASIELNKEDRRRCVNNNLGYGLSDTVIVSSFIRYGMLGDISNNTVEGCWNMILLDGAHYSNFKYISDTIFFNSLGRSNVQDVSETKFLQQINESDIRNFTSAQSPVDTLMIDCHIPEYVYFNGRIFSKELLNFTVLNPAPLACQLYIEQYYSGGTYTVSKSGLQVLLGHMNGQHVTVNSGGVERYRYFNPSIGDYVWSTADYKATMLAQSKRIEKLNEIGNVYLTGALTQGDTLIYNLIQQRWEAKPSVQVLQTTGTSTTATMSQKVLTDRLKAITDILDARFPFTITSFTGGKVVENGTSTSVSLAWVYDGTPSTQELKQGTTVITTALTDRAKSVTGVTGSSTDIVYTLTANGLSRTTTVQFRNPKYIGNVTGAPTTESAIKALTKIAVTTSKSYTWNGNLTNNSVVYCYPKSFGALTSIKDGSGFEYLSSFALSEVSVNSEVYYVYTSPVATATGFRYIFT